ncbi:MAG: hypothetical protein R3C44_12375 [Chloroflexota bacterium]
MSLDPEALASAAQVVEAQYLPSLQATFGREWSPGIDQTPRFMVLHVLGSRMILNWGISATKMNIPIRSFYIPMKRKWFIWNMSRLEVESDLYLGTLLHELQHLSQWNMDANEEVWMNEGLSQLAETMAGLDTVDPSAYLEQPRIRLDRWSNSAE